MRLMCSGLRRAVDADDGAGHVAGQIACQEQKMLATSSGSPMRRSGIGAEIRATSSSGSAATMSVRVPPVTIAVFPCSSSYLLKPEFLCP